MEEPYKCPACGEEENIDNENIEFIADTMYASFVCNTCGCCFEKTYQITHIQTKKTGYIGVYV